MTTFAYFTMFFVLPEHYFIYQPPSLKTLNFLIDVSYLTKLKPIFLMIFCTLVLAVISFRQSKDLYSFEIAPT